MSPQRHDLPDRIAGTLVNRADLLLALAKRTPEARAAAAAACGFQRRQEREEDRPAVAVVPGPVLPVEDRNDDKPPSPTELRFLQAVAYQSLEVPVTKQEAPPEIGDQPISEGELDVRPYRVKPNYSGTWLAR